MRTALSALALALLLLVAAPTGVSADDVAGHWTGQMTVGAGAAAIPFVLDLKIDGTTLTGTFCLRDCTTDKPQPIQNATVNGSSISFTVTATGLDPPQLNFYGYNDGTTIEFILSGKGPQCLGFDCQVGNASATRSK